jgi:tRNA1Val (adenine37-N6)-methyltransferase
MVALELQESLADLARRNILLNGLGGGREAGGADLKGFRGYGKGSRTAISRSGAQAEIIQGDIRNVEEMFEPNSFGLVVSNPPYRPTGQGRLSPSMEKAIARHERLCSLQDLVKAAAYLLKPEGFFTFCQLGERMREIADTLRRYGFRITRRKDAGVLLLIEAKNDREQPSSADSPNYLCRYI